MNAISKVIDFEVFEHFDDDGTLIVSVYPKGMEEPLITHEIQISSVVNDFLDIVCNPKDGFIDDGADEEQAENIIDELQAGIDLLNDALRDYDNLTN